MRCMSAIQVNVKYKAVHCKQNGHSFNQRQTNKLVTVLNCAHLTGIFIKLVCVTAVQDITCVYDTRVMNTYGFLIQAYFLGGYFGRYAQKCIQTSEWPLN